MRYAPLDYSEGWENGSNVSTSSVSSLDTDMEGVGPWDAPMPRRRRRLRSGLARLLRRFFCCFAVQKSEEVYFDAKEHQTWDFRVGEIEEGPTWSQAPLATEEVLHGFDEIDAGEAYAKEMEAKTSARIKKKEDSSLHRRRFESLASEGVVVTRDVDPAGRRLVHRRRNGHHWPSCPISRKHWSESTLLYRLRGPSYLVDHVKVPVDSSESVFELGAVDLIYRKHNEHICAREDSWVHKSGAIFHFVLYLMVPPCFALVFYWVLPENKRGILEGDTPFARVLQGFLNGSDEHRNHTFKLIPTAVEGPWLVRKAVRSTPTLIGCRLLQTYHFGSNYVEVDVNIATNRVAQRTCSLLVGAMKGVVCDLAIVLEGKSEDMLPEALLGTVRMQRVDLAEVSRKEGLPIQ